MKTREPIDYEKLRLILERQYERAVTADEAKGTGDFLLNVYEILLDNGGEYVTIKEHTTNQ